MAEIPDDVKIFLRSVLVTTPGMPQSQVAREYYETTDERIEYVKYGYKNIFEFLIALQGEVTRLEFSPKHGDNLVFAVLDKTKFASKHAQKYASKTNTGMLPKSPEQILIWKKEHLERGTLPVAVKKKSSRGGRPRQRNNNPKTTLAASRRFIGGIAKPSIPKPLVQRRPPSPARSVTAETSASIDEWSLLRRLLPERENKFTLLVREVGVSQLGKFRNQDLFSHFAAYNIHKDVTYRFEYAHRDVTKRQEWACISFPTHFTAFRAWKEKHNSIMLGRRLGVEPAGGSLKSLSTHLYKVMVVGLPNDIIMSTFVTKFVRFSNLVCIDAKPRESCAIIVYSKEESAQRACTEITKIKVNGEMVSLNVQPLEDEQAETLSPDPTADQKLTKLSYNPTLSSQRKECIDFIRNDCFRGSNCIYSHDIQRSKVQRTLPEPVCADYRAGRCNRAVCKFLHIDRNEEERYRNTGVFPARLGDRFSKEQQYFDEKMPQFVSKTPQLDEKKETNEVDSNVIEDLISFEDRVCRFCITYQQWFQMFQITRRKQAKILNNYPEDIQFLVTYQTDPIRFWVWLMMDDVEKKAQKLNAIEEDIALNVAKVQPPTNLPKAGHRGAALFKDGSNETWYRCYVLSSNAEKDAIEVFYCDYGNSEWIDRELFRSTYNNTWLLDPLAVPMKLCGVELREDIDLSTYEKLSISEVLYGKVVRDSTYSEPHIVEVKSITYSSTNRCIDDELSNKWCVSTDQLQLKTNTQDKKAKKNDSEVNCIEDNLLRAEENKEKETIRDEGGYVNKEAVQGGEEDESEDHDGDECSQDEDDEETNNEWFGVASSLLDYNQEDLVDGLICEAHHPNLIYLRLGDTSAFDLLQHSLNLQEQILPNHIDVDNILMLCGEEGRRRVQVIQMLPAFQKAKVLHVDYGNIEWVNIASLNLLPQDLQDALFQVRPASLAGVDCTQKMDKAVAYLKSKSNTEVKVNVILENEDGKVSVELFDTKKGMSINKALIDTGLALYNMAYDLQDAFTPSLVAIPVEQLEKWKDEEPGSSDQQTKERTSSGISWHTNVAMSFGDGGHANVGSSSYDEWGDEVGDTQKKSDGAVGDDDEVFKDLSAISASSLRALKTDSYQTSAGTSNYHSSSTRRRDFNYFFQELLDNQSNGVSNPAPDVVKSANELNQEGTSCDNGASASIQIEGEVIDFDLTKPVVDPNKRNKMCALWVSQKKKLEDIERRLSRLLAMPDEDVRKHYIELKKEKIMRAVSVTEARKFSEKLDHDNNTVIEETNRVLSLV